VRLAASVGNRSRTSTAAKIANIRLLGQTSGERHVSTGWEVLANLPLHTALVTSSVHPGFSGVQANLRIFAQAATQRIVAELVAIRPRADTTTKYIVACVARVPQVSGAPVFLEVDPIDWTSLDWSEALNDTPSLSTSVKIDKMTEPVLQRIRTPHELPTEIWCFRNGKKVFSGPLVGGSVQGDSINLEARGIASYLQYMDVESDLVFTGVDQATIVQTLVNQWQALEYGNFGIDTSNIAPTGVLRTVTYLLNELHNVADRIDDLRKMDNAFDWDIDPGSRALRLWSPTRGVDRSTGEDAIIFDARNVTNSDLQFVIAPGELASEGLATASNSGADVPLISRYSNPELRAKFGRIGMTGNFDLADQASLDSANASMINTRSQVLLMPGPDARVTLDADLSQYDVGDWIGYQAHGRLSVAGAYRLKKRSVKVSSTGTESVSVEFV
jgi:hypothetical protein